MPRFVSPFGSGGRASSPRTRERTYARRERPGEDGFRRERASDRIRAHPSATIHRPRLRLHPSGSSRTTSATRNSRARISCQNTSHRRTPTLRRANSISDGSSVIDAPTRQNGRDSPTVRSGRVRTAPQPPARAPEHRRRADTFRPRQRHRPTIATWTGRIRCRLRSLPERNAFPERPNASRRRFRIVHRPARAPTRAGTQHERGQPQGRDDERPM